MAVGSFSQKISIEGADEIRSALALLGQAGEQAFQQIQKAVGGANAALATMPAVLASVGTAFAGVGTAATRVGASLTALGGNFKNLGSSLSLIAGIGLPLTFAAAAAAMVKFVTSSADAGDEVNKLSQSLGLTVEQYQRLSFAAGQAGIDQQQFGRALTQLSKQVQDGLKDQDKAFADFATAVGKETSIAIRSLTTTATTAGITFQQLQEGAQGLAARLKAAGIDVSFNDIIKKLSEMSKGSAESRRELELLLGSVKLGGTALQNLQAHSASAGNALLKLGIPLRNADGTVRDLEQILGDLAEKFQAMPNGIEKNNRALELFGERVGRRLIPFLNQGRAGIKALTDEFSKATTGFTKKGAEAAEAMNDAFSSLGTTLEDFRNQIAAPLFEPLTRFARGLQSSLQANRKEIEAFGEAVRARVVPVIEDFINLIAGRRELIQSSFIAQLPERILAFGSAVKGAIFGVVIPAFTALIALLQLVADGINSVFGTKLTGGQLAIGLLILQFSGLAAGVTNVILALGSLAIALAAPFTAPWILVLGAGIALLVSDIVRLNELFGATGKAAEDGSTGLELFGRRIAFIVDQFARFLPIAGVVAGALRLFGIRSREASQETQKAATAATQSGAALFTTGQRVAQLTQQLADGSISAQEYARQLNLLTQSTNTVAGASAAAGIQVRTLANEAGIAVRTATQGAGIVVREVAASVQSLAKAGQDASVAAGTGVDALAAEVDSVTTAAVPAESALSALGRIGFSGTVNQIQTVINTINELIRKAAEGKSALEQMGSSGGGGGGGGAGGFAGGGYVSGAGSSTSDSILARLSNGEFVIRAAAVDHFGADFFRALNALRTPKFSMGGLVDGLNASLIRNFSLPGFAMGGLVNAQAQAASAGLHPVTINFGGHKITGLLAPADVVTQLRRAAINEQILSAGRKPT
jgi:hypothetical protein